MKFTAGMFVGIILGIILCFSAYVWNRVDDIGRNGRVVFVVFHSAKGYSVLCAGGNMFGWGNPTPSIKSWEYGGSPCGGLWFRFGGGNP